ncbi:MAG: YdcF family protein [Oscillibacter sp.]|nr:YdcF family protein [uncultured Oscillibacter sp.]MCI9299242.1 YdcF family protein [Oscillibacter sp.]MCI9460332.1 YdcF family protein [Oscillibacter sp.]
MTAKRLRRIGRLTLACAGLALVSIPNGMKFTGYFLLGTLAIWYCGMYLHRWGKRSRRGQACYRVFLAGLGLGIVCLAGIEAAVVFRGEADNSAIPVDAVIVLGAGVNGETPSAALWSRIRAAEDYLEIHPDVPVVLSGGQGAGEAISEAEAMRRALWKEDGAENARLLLEERSTNTAENFRFSKALLEERGLDTGRATIAVVTNDFHCFRAHMIARRQGLKTIDVPAELPWWWLTANYYLREAFAVVKTSLFDLN